MSTCVIRLPWERKFLAALAQGLGIKVAAQTAGISASTAYGLRRQNGRFAGEWAEAYRKGGRQPKILTRSIQWKKVFFEALAETSNVSAAAARVNIPTATVYRLKREDPEFAARWLAALHEGYDHLEIEVLGYLRDLQPTRKMDVAGALRLLAAHRDTVERRRAMMEEEDEQAVLDSIDAFLEGMRERRLVNEALEREAKSGDVAR